MKKLILLILLVSCQNTHKTMQTTKEFFDIQGHRGCRGLMPENTIPAFLKAIDIGVSTLELDVVVSKDGQLVVSHEPYLSPVICTGTAGENFDDEKKYNLYQMTYTEISQCDCGGKVHPKYPEQQKMKVSKPLLTDMIDAVESYLKEKKLPPIRYNIETKSDPKTDDVAHPAPAVFVNLLYKTLQAKGILERSTVQSFDIRTLQEIKKLDTKLSLALLIESSPYFEKNIQELGFKPAIYSPYFALVTDALVSYCKKENIKLIPWTVNDYETMLKLKAQGVDGVITDYPDRAMKLLEK
ncbi:MAG: glycerophosphodiester phosphodiesterase [Cytophagales bacterium]|nr:MAG: glycerophosphodiester phosphodiesterase [Cytophagales bacterium]